MKKTIFAFLLIILGLSAVQGINRQRIFDRIYGRGTSEPFRRIIFESDSNPCVDLEQNVLEFPFDKENLEIFFSKLDRLLTRHEGHVTLWHVGGSHVQGDMFSHRVRCNFSTLVPDIVGNRGMLFPFAMARTNYDHNYHMTYTGHWNTERNISRNLSYRLGLTGIAAQTSDTLSSITLNLNVGKFPTWRFNRLRILGYASDEVEMWTVDRKGRVAYPTHDAENDTYTFDYREYNDSITVFFGLQRGERFTLTGVEPINTAPGISYYSSGINGAAAGSWLRCKDLERDLALIKPDVALWAIGINDAAVPSSKFDEEVFMRNYRKLINKVNSVSPDCLHIFITNNDTYRKGSANVNAETVDEAFRNLAIEYNGCIWNVYEIMGGLGSSTRWRSLGLMQSDRIHFTRLGYQLLGDLLFNAIMKEYMNQ
ncbi:MAG: hypothetical protein IK053_04360 [Muribaculaceae bacterium]|nr:hypothetical protein [Muribaculaceae bacterium]